MHKINFHILSMHLQYSQSRSQNIKDGQSKWCFTLTNTYTSRKERIHKIKEQQKNKKNKGCHQWLTCIYDSSAQKCKSHAKLKPLHEIAMKHKFHSWKTYYSQNKWPKIKLEKKKEIVKEKENKRGAGEGEVWKIPFFTVTLPSTWLIRTNLNLANLLHPIGKLTASAASK